jgi:hypothetical protein
MRLNPLANLSRDLIFSSAIDRSYLPAAECGVFLVALLLGIAFAARGQINCATWSQGSGFNDISGGNRCPDITCVSSGAGYQCMVNGMQFSEWYEATPYSTWYQCVSASNRSYYCAYYPAQCETMYYYADAACDTPCTDTWYWESCEAATSL